jgi:hypothetical protein
MRIEGSRGLVQGLFARLKILFLIELLVSIEAERATGLGAREYPVRFSSRFP